MTQEWGAIDAGYAPLFDRLTDHEPSCRHEGKPLRTLDRAGLIDSVGRELLRLFSTRCTATVDAVLCRPRTVLDYGLPDLAAGDSEAIPERRLRLARVLRGTIEAFEPRLTGVRVEVRDTGVATGKLSALVEGYLVTGEVTEPISFMLPVGGGASADGG